MPRAGGELGALRPHPGTEMPIAGWRGWSASSREARPWCRVWATPEPPSLAGHGLVRVVSLAEPDTKWSGLSVSRRGWWALVASSSTECSCVRWSALVSSLGLAAEVEYVSEAAHQRHRSSPFQTVSWGGLSSWAAYYVGGQGPGRDFSTLGLSTTVGNMWTNL